MANIMSMKSLKNRVSQNGFDLSKKSNFTSKCGELLPYWWKFTLPGDKWSIDLKSFTRTVPATAPAYARSRKYYDFYFVPLSLIWNKFNTTITQMNNNVQHSSGVLLEDNAPVSGYFPHCTLQEIVDYLKYLAGSSSANNYFGLSRATLAIKLLSYFGILNYTIWEKLLKGEETGINLSQTINLFPLFVYQKIYSDFFRNTQWEKPNPSSFNVDFMTGKDLTSMNYMQRVKTVDSTFAKFVASYNLFDLRYCDFQKDIFHGILPQAQYGETTYVSLGGDSSLPSTLESDSFSLAYFGKGSQNDSAIATGKSWSTGENSLTKFNVDTRLPDATSGSLTIDNIRFTGSNTLSILALRKAEAYQKWKEISQSGDEDYQTQISKHWDENVSDYLSGRAQYLGGVTQDIMLNEVVNTNITGENGADLAGKGTGSSDGHISFDSRDQYGIIICLQHTLPIVDYITSGLSSEWTTVQASDMPIPEFDSIGMETMNLQSLSAAALNKATVPPFIGYVPRYIWWKTDFDRSYGDFTKSLLNWVLPYDDEDVSEQYNFPASAIDNPNVNTGKTMRYPFFKVNPNIFDGIFNVKADADVNTDYFLDSVFFKVNVVRKLDRDGLPY
jgi:hypothetical protein|nr:MAG TPA: Major capsid protein [Microviridae sp.]